MRSEQHHRYVWELNQVMEKGEVRTGSVLCCVVKPSPPSETAIEPVPGVPAVRFGTLRNMNSHLNRQTDARKHAQTTNTMPAEVKCVEAHSSMRNLGLSSDNS